jgi:hypothetical protein
VEFLTAVYIKAETRRKEKKHENKRIILETLTEMCNFYLQCISRLRLVGRRTA